MINDRVIVLTKRRYSEADLIITGLNPQGSKLDFIAKSALKSRRRFGGGILDPFCYIKVLYTPPKKGYTSELNFLQEAELISDFPRLRTSWERLELGFYFLKLLEKASHHNTLDSHGLFDLLGNTLKNLETTAELGKLQLHFEIKLLAQNGTLPVEYQSSPLLGLPINDHCHLPSTAQFLKKTGEDTKRLIREYLNIVREDNSNDHHVPSQNNF